MAGRVPVGQGHHHVQRGQSEHEVEERPGVLDSSSLAVSSVSLPVLGVLRVCEVDGVRHGDPGSAVIGG